jgi:hypothetical protein
VVYELLAACELVRTPEQRWHLVSSKTAFFGRIDAAATIAETYLVTSMKGRQYGLNQDIGERCRGMAHGLREMQGWVLSPKSDTHYHLKQRLWRTLCYFANGEWDTVPTLVAGRQRPSLLRNALAFLGRAGAILIAFLLLSLALGLLPIGQGIPLIVRSFMWVSALGLLAVGFPSLAERLNFRKHLDDLLVALKPKDQ